MVVSPFTAKSSCHKVHRQAETAAMEATFTSSLQLISLLYHLFQPVSPRIREHMAKEPG